MNIDYCSRFKFPTIPTAETAEKKGQVYRMHPENVLGDTLRCFDLQKQDSLKESLNRSENPYEMLIM